MQQFCLMLAFGDNDVAFVPGSRYESFSMFRQKKGDLRNGDRITLFH
jgi:hypothetical protein